MSEPLHPEHQDLLQFLYQFPIGVIAMDDRGDVSLINPAASNLLTPEIEEGESVARPLPLLRRLIPELVDKLEADPDHVGMVTTGRGWTVDGRDGTTRVAVTAHRLRRDHIMLSLTDVTEERRILNEQRLRAQRLQRALLGHTDATDLQLSVAYLPANREDLSGGDWYDVIRLDDGRVALVVGDVVGHDIEASATMGQLRAIVRAFALIDADPTNVLQRTDAIARTIDDATCATIHYAVLDPTAATVTYASAGHPPPLLIRADGGAELLSGGRRPAIAVSKADGTGNEAANLADGDVLLLYTDGLVERRGETLDEGLTRLTTTADGLRDAGSTDELVERLTRGMLEGTNHRDDVCVLAVRHRADAGPPSSRIPSSRAGDPGVSASDVSGTADDHR